MHHGSSSMIIGSLIMATIAVVIAATAFLGVAAEYHW